MHWLTISELRGGIEMKNRTKPLAELVGVAIVLACFLALALFI